jgi:hypothetical protein
MSVRRKEWSLTWPLESRKIKKARGESLKIEGTLWIPKKLSLKLTLPFSARVQFESLQRGELDPFFMKESEIPSLLSSAEN